MMLSYTFTLNTIMRLIHNYCSKHSSKMYANKDNTVHLESGGCKPLEMIIGVNYYVFWETFEWFLKTIYK